jgi:hypothetical protein
MQPDLATQLTGIRRVLQEVVAPAVTDRFAAAQLASVCDALGMLAERWPRELGRWLRESEGLRALFAELAPELARCGVRASELARRVTEAARASREPLAASASEPEFREAHRELRALLVESIRALREHPDPAQRDALRKRIRDQLASDLAHKLDPPR